MRLIERRVTRGVDPPEVEGYQWDGWKLIMIAKLNTDGTFHSRKWSCVWRPDIGSSLYARSDWMRAGGVGGVAWLQTGTVQNYSYGTGSSEAHVPLADHMGNVRHYYQFKASGSKVTGQLVASYEYDAFGREVRAWGLNTPATNQPPGLPANRPWADLLPFHYSSKLRDVDSGFNYYGYRFYDPGAGRWLNRDPIGEEGGVNLYGFCQNQPIGLIDVFGGFPAGGYVGGPSGVASFNVDGHGSGKWHPTSPEEKERILAMQQAAIELVIPIEAFRQLMNGNIVAASGDLIMGRLKFLKLARKVGTSRMAHSGGKCCVAIEAQIVKVPVAKGSVSPLTGCGTAPRSATGPNTKVVKLPETTAPKPVKPEAAVDEWNNFRGPGPHTNVHPRTGAPDPNRIVSADGTRSIRYGNHEMGSKPTKHHYHEETWSYDEVSDTMTIGSMIKRVPLK
jgi:RHS repeat-associated protein